MRTLWPLLAGALVLGACDITNPPNWTADYLFPLNFPAVDLSGIPGGVIPIDSVSFTTPVITQDAEEGLVGRILQSEDLAALRAEVILRTTLDVTGAVELSIATSQAGLFDPAQSLTTTISVSQGTNTSFVDANLAVFKGATTLYFQSNVTVAGPNGSIAVPPGSEIGIGVNFIGTVRVSK
ncbi:MAG: hypothetical protein OEY20_00070 [Gemmatimonadota bacterium]|nr:hypothetical protein [Gemmatimonadota bacterium]MDH4350320.1 hypothetical protein [Gemmatimonadota bacterium]MDH5195630.1 hypothetical protein [Gemmatimonadota bacterium]